MILLQIGGIENHTHALISAPTTISPAQAAKYLKGDSSLWIHREFKTHQDFAWQDGYGVFSVSPSHVDAVSLYIENHGKRT